MERSQYNTLVQIDESTWLAFNHTRGKLLRVSPRVRQFLRGESGIRLSLDEREVLTEKGFLVTSRQAELDTIRHQIYQYRYGPQRVGYSVIPTYACNLRCPYCYEDAQRPSHRTMSQSVAEQTVAHIMNEVRTAGSEGLTVTLYGGEPLLKPDITKYLIDRLGQGCKQLGVPFESYLITNGTLLNRNTIRDLKPALSMVQLTLEGSREHHNSIRVNASGNGTFSRILRSAKLCVEAGIHVQFRIQLTPDTWEGAAACMQELSDKGYLTHPLVNAYFFPILDVSGVCSARSFSCFDQYFSAEMLEELWSIALRHQANVFQAPQPVWVQPFCSFVSKHSWLVDPLGKKYKCVSLIGQEDAVAGSVFEPEDPIERTRYLARELALVERLGTDFAECRSCEFLPSCDGGCAVRAQAKNGSMQTSICEMHRDPIPTQIAYYYRSLVATGAAEKVPEL